MTAEGWEFHRDRLTDTFGRLLRRHPDADDYDRILLDRAVASLLSIDALLEPTQLRSSPPATTSPALSM